MLISGFESFSSSKKLPMAKHSFSQHYVTIGIFLFLFMELSYCASRIGEYENVCYGTALGLTKMGEPSYRYNNYKHRYTNCTYLVGNLEIAFLDTPGVLFDLSFLKYIQEVTGYVLFVANSIDYLHLDSLRIIRGQPMFEYQNNTYSLFVALNYEVNNKFGLKELRMTNLTEIMDGTAFFKNNQHLCYENTIDWKDINPTGTPPVQIISSKPTPVKRECGRCSEACRNSQTNKTQCWGAGKNMCQKLSHGDVCHDNCGDSRCYGPQPNQCCHPQCAGGCHGPRKTECVSCRHFRDGHSCVAACPAHMIYDTKTMTKVPNPNVKYAFGSMCVQECPDHLLHEGGHCVRTCSYGRHAQDQKFCTDCKGPCPLTCKGLDIERSEFLSSANIDQFDGCTYIDGSLRILSSSFSDDPHHKTQGLNMSDLMVLKHVKEITGYLLIQSNDPEFTNLSFLSSLEIIHGRTITDRRRSLDIMSTPLRSLELTSLKSIRNGDVLLLRNNMLCFVSNIKWDLIFNHKDQKAVAHFNKPSKECMADGEVCDPQCGSNGCWGKGADRCLKCANYEFEEERMCLSNCHDKPLLYHKGEGKCAQCHLECADSCTGPKDTDCERCANVIMRDKDNVDSCQTKCVDSMFPDENKICKPCHRFCGVFGCTGAGKFVGQGGCNRCEVGIRRDRNRVDCLHPDTYDCDRGFFMSNKADVNRSNRICEKCHYLCLACTSYSTEFCTDCRFFRNEKHCVHSCPNFYFSNTVNKTCDYCHEECREGCSGPTSFNCTACAKFKIPLDEIGEQFNCTSACPDNLPHVVKDHVDDDNRILCADDSHPDVMALRAKDASEEKNKIIIILSCTVPGAIILMIMVTVIGYFCYKRAQNNKKAAEYTAKITGCDDIEPLTPTSAKPDLAQMRLINESELRRGTIIGSGAFGTVYKGIWIPQGESVKIPVAIKVLQEGTSANQSTELLDEARVMCSVEHICCVRILAVCMSSQMMLITQLMPHGCLLEYVRANKTHIGSKVLLNWCTQIARGMAYLEEHQIVHRDLAARNVLVQTPNQVKITDFGLAKLLDYNTEEYHASGGLMPIKWLALECIQHRIFTHKSDVWSYGVTIWELFTYGKKPYDGIRTRDVPMMLEKGERLQQPMICTIDVYMIMVKCWMLESSSRPSFKELAEEFAKMSRDPGRYLVIEGDELRKFPDSCFAGSDLELDPLNGLPRGAEGAEGDKLMRLPSDSYDKHELIRGMSECPGEVMEAEEYLQPQGPSSAQVTFERQHSHSPSNMMPISEHGRMENGAAKRPRDGDKVREKKYGHLNAAAKAKQERGHPSMREGSFSSRYSSDPIKFTKDKGEVAWHPGSTSPTQEDQPHSPRMGPESPFTPIGKPPPTPLPVDEDNYLQPKVAAMGAYADLSSNGYYQNEKAFGSTNAEPIVLDPSERVRNGSSSSSHASSRHPLNSHSHSINSVNSGRQRNPSTSAVANPEYFESDMMGSHQGINDDEEDDDVWEPKGQTRNGYQPVPNGPASPAHSSKENGYAYYNDVNGGTPHKVNTKVSVSNTPNSRHASESMV